MATGLRGNAQPWRTGTETFHDQITASMTWTTGSVAITRSMS